MPNTVVWGGTYGLDTYGTAPYASRAFDATTPSIANLSPANGATGVSDSATVSFQVSSPSHLDPWSLSVNIGGNPIIAGGDFLPTYGSSIIFSDTTCTVTIDTHPNWASGSNAVAISVTDLAGNSQTFNSTFTTTSSNVVGVSDSVSVSDSLFILYSAYVTGSDTISVSDSITTLHQVGHAPVSETVTVTDAVGLQHHTHPTVSDSVSVSDSTSLLHRTSVAVSDTVTASDSVSEYHAYFNTVTDSVSVSDSLTRAYRARPFVSETVAVTDQISITLHAGGGGGITLSDTVSASDALAFTVAFHQALADTASLSDAVSTHHATQASLSDTVGVSDSASPRYGHLVALSDTVSVSDALSFNNNFTNNLSETVFLSENGVFSAGTRRAVADTVTLSDAARAGNSDNIHFAPEVLNVSDAVTIGTSATSVSVSEEIALIDEVEVSVSGVISQDQQLLVQFREGVRLDRVSDPVHYQLSGGGVPTMVLSATPVQTLLGTFHNGAILGSGEVSYLFAVGSEPVELWNYILISTPWQNTIALVVGLPSPGVVELDTPLIVADPDNGSITWQHLTPVNIIILTIAEPTNNDLYQLQISGLIQADGAPYNQTTNWVANAVGPLLQSATYLPNEGAVLVTFSKGLTIDAGLLDPAIYVITGPTPVTVTGVQTVTQTQVLLSARGFTAGTYVLTIQVIYGPGTEHALIRIGPKDTSLNYVPE